MYLFPAFLLSISCICSHWVNANDSCYKGVAVDVALMPIACQMQVSWRRGGAEAEWLWKLSPRRVSSSCHSHQCIKESTDLRDCKLQK